MCKPNTWHVRARNTKKNCSLEMTNLELDTFDWNLTFFLWDDALGRLFHYFSPDLFHVIYVLLFVWFLTHFCVDVVCMLIMPKDAAFPKSGPSRRWQSKVGLALRTAPSMCPRALSHVITQQKIIFP
jgi:hypothetical protein